MPFILTCVKTGRFWVCATYEQCERTAQREGLKDYTIGRDE